MELTTTITELGQTWFHEVSLDIKTTQLSFMATLKGDLAAISRN